MPNASRKGQAQQHFSEGTGQTPPPPILLRCFSFMAWDACLPPAWISLPNTCEAAGAYSSGKYGLTAWYASTHLFISQDFCPSSFQDLPEGLQKTLEK